MNDALKIGTLGNCPVCEGEFKVRDGKLVHHGYKRPGDGMIHGDCFAVGYEPYQRSTKGCEDYKAMVESQLAGLENHLRRLQEGQITHFTEIHPRWNGGHDVLEYVIGVTDRYDMVRYFERKVAEVAGHINAAQFEIDRMNRLIAGWSLKELREVTEEMVAAQTKAQRDARAAERAAKQASKNEKAAALKAKRDARQAKRDAAFNAFIAALKSLDTTESRYSKEELERGAREVWRSFFSKKNRRELGDLLDFYYDIRKLGHEDLIVRVGLGRREEDGWVHYYCSVNP